MAKFEVPDGEPPHPDESFSTEEVAYRVADRHEKQGDAFKTTIWKDEQQLQRPV